MAPLLWLLAAAAIAVVALAPLPHRLEARLLARTARRIGLPLTGAARATLARRAARTRRWSGIAAVLGLLTGLVLTRGGAEDGASVVIVSAGGILSAAGIAFAAITDVGSGRGAGGPRVARSRRIELNDLLPPFDRVVAWVATAVSVVLCGSGALFGPAVPAAVLIASVLLSVSALVILEVGGRQAADAPQPAGSSDELAWSDAVRSMDLRAIAFVPVFVGAFGPQPLVFVDGPFATLAQVGILLVLVWGGANVLVGPHLDRWFLRRLWPARAAEQARFETEVAR